MKLTNTLRTIAFSGLGLLIGTSTLTLSAQDAHAMSGTPTPVMTESRSTWINLELVDSIQVGRTVCTWEAWLYFALPMFDEQFG